MRLPLSCLFLALTLAACSSDPAAPPPPTDAGPEVGGDVTLLPDVGTVGGGGGFAGVVLHALRERYDVHETARSCGVYRFVYHSTRG